MDTDTSESVNKLCNRSKIMQREVLKVYSGHALHGRWPNGCDERTSLRKSTKESV
jgi:hypothetical protein